MSSVDAIVVGSGPNGLSAAVALLQAGRSVLVLEGRDTLGGGTRTHELDVPGFLHDACSAVHPMGVLSPFWRTLPLHEHGLRWAHPPISVAHPLDDGDSPLLQRDVGATTATLDPADARAWARMVRPFVARADDLLPMLLGPLRFPRHPLLLARFGLLGLRSATMLARRFDGVRARALLAGCAGHSILPFDKFGTGAVGLVFAVTGHLVDWPVAVGGSRAISDALVSLVRSLGGELRTGAPVDDLTALPPHRALLFDTDPAQVARLAGDRLPATYRRRLGRYRYGPGTFKLDWALDGPIPWRDPQAARASTVHVGGTFEEIAAAEADAWHGRVPERPFLILCQQSHFDPSRAPDGRHTGYAYCHVPSGCTVDMVERIEAQIERFAPGFRDRIMARHATSPAGFAARNPNYVGGAITGGSADLTQLFTRPVARLNPYTTPDPSMFLCSASTPPGGGVHGMCGYFAARAALRRILK